MSFTKPIIYNLALSALLLSKEISDVDTDTSNEVRILNTHWNIAFQATLQDLDLDSTMQPLTLELLESLVDEPWTYAYKYPTNCLFLRRIKSLQITDNKSTHISKQTGIWTNKKAIFTDQKEAVAECIPKSLPLDVLSPMAALAIAYKLAFLSAPLLVGKGAAKLRRTIQEDYLIAKSEAQETDALENFNYEADDLRSEFVEARLS